LGKYSSYTAQFKVELIKFAEQNGNRAAEREFFVNDTHILYWLKQKKGCAKQDAAFREPQNGKNVLSLKKNYLNTSSKHGTTAAL
jgi:hypothetical protein